jgi:hypothetical protein
MSSEGVLVSRVFSSQWHSHPKSILVSREFSSQVCPYRADITDMDMFRNESRAYIQPNGDQALIFPSCGYRHATELLISPNMLEKDREDFHRD